MAALGSSRTGSSRRSWRRKIGHQALQQALFDRLFDDFADAVLFNSLVILAIFEHRAEGVFDDRVVEPLCAKPAEGRGPVDGFGDARRLVKVEAAQAFDRSSDLLGEHVVDARHTEFDDFNLSVKAGVLNPVIQATSLECVVHVTGAVRGQHDQRRLVGHKHADLGHGDLEVGEDLQQVRLEFVVGPVDFVDEEHGRRALGRLDCPKQCSLDEEPFAVQLSLKRIGRRRLRFTGRLRCAQVAAVCLA